MPFIRQVRVLFKKVVMINNYLDEVSKQCIIKQLLDSAFVISGIIKVEVSVISRAEGRG